MTLASPVGELRLVADASALVAIAWPGEAVDMDGVVEVGRGGHPVLDRAVEQLTEYFAGDRTEFDLPLAPAGTPFQHEAWAVLRTIPFGGTITYGEQARRLGDARKSRAVGAANGRNPIPIVVPCHRVIGADGRLTGFAAGLDTKSWLLTHEAQTRSVCL